MVVGDHRDRRPRTPRGPIWIGRSSITGTNMRRNRAINDIESHGEPR